MFKNYLKIALRNIKKEKFYSILNIAGLCIGISATLFIYLYVNSEMSYDKFHADAERIHRVGLHGKMAGQEILTSVTCAPMAEALVEEFPEVEAATRISTLSDEVVRYDETAYTENNVIFADSNFFQFFSFHLLEGDPKTALVDPHTIVLTPKMAKKYFGDEPALGKLLTLGRFNSTYKVTGVVEEAPSNSHFKFDFILSASSSNQLKSTMWINNNLYTYFKLYEGTSVENFENKLDHLVTKYVGPEVEQFMGVSLEQMRSSGGAYGYLTTPMLDIHLKAETQDQIEPGGNITYVYIFIGIAALIMLIACINFMNLATARSAGRAKEVGLRKTLGSLRSTLIAQFLSESFLYSLISTILAFAVVAALLPQFNLLSGKELTLEALLTPEFIGVGILMIILIGFIAGSYPAFYLTSFEPAEVLKGKVKEGMKSGFVRSSLVTLQFFISTFLIICTAVVYNQIQYFQNKNLGMDKNNVLVISNAERLQSNMEAFKKSLESETSIKNISYTTSLFPGVNNNTVFRHGRKENDHIMGTYAADYDHLDVLGFKMAEGRYFSEDFPSDSTAAVINEAAVAELGYENPLEEDIIFLGGGGTPQRLKIIGVVKDFNYEGLQGKVRPVVIRLTKTANGMLVKYEGEPKQAVDKLENQWKLLAANEPFEYRFLDDDFDALFRAEQRLGSVFTVFTGLAIFIACLGLIGLSAFTAQKRIKEIGVRKVMGASETSLVILLNKEFTKLVIIAFFIAAPLAYFAMDNWLNNFAYRIDIGWMVFGMAALITLLVAWMTVSFQSLKAAKSNPINALRSE